MTPAAQGLIDIYYMVLSSNLERCGTERVVDGSQVTMIALWVRQV